MKKNFFSELTENQLVIIGGGQYKSPEVKVLTFQPEGVLCASVYNEHQEFTFDSVEDL